MNEDDENELLDSLMDAKRNVSWGQVLTDRHAFFALASCFFGTYAIIDYTGFISEAMTKYY